LAKFNSSFIAFINFLSPSSILLVIFYLSTHGQEACIEHQWCGQKVLVWPKTSSINLFFFSRSGLCPFFIKRKSNKVHKPNTNKA
jgi:hypothetical protein